MEDLPDTGPIPITMTSPAGHAAASDLRRDVGFQDEEDAGQGDAILKGFASRIPKSTLRCRENRFNQSPESV